MLFETIKTPGLAQLSYLVGDGKGSCAVIDPRRDVEVYVGLAHERGARITHILETHIHADFVSGSLELSKRTGAPIHGGPSNDYRFEVKQLNDGEELEVGSLTFRALHTPGHSPEHVCFVVRGGGKGAEEDWAVFTGDTLFAGEVGRPDLAAGHDKREMARALYASLFEGLLALDDGLEVYPAHGQGSPCGGSIGVRDRSTIGYERQHNPKLQVSSEEAFVEKVLGDLPREPFYYERVKRVNASGPEPLGVLPHLPILTPEAFNERLGQGDTLVVDTREIAAFAGAHIPGSLNIALRSLFPIWAGWMLEPKQPLLLVLDSPSDIDEAQRQLLRVGLDKLEGILAPMRGWIESGLPFAKLEGVSVQELKAQIGEKPESLQLLDVRRDDEWQEGHIPTAKHLFLPLLEDNLAELEQDKPVTVYCGSGYRSSIAASLLKKHGFRVKNVLGSMSAWKAAGYALDTPSS